MKSCLSLVPAPNRLREFLTVSAFAAAGFAGLSAYASTDYGPARWMGVCGASESSTSGNWYTTGFGKRFIVIHDIEGYYQGFIYNSRHCIGRAGEESVHYSTNGKQDSGDPYAPGDMAQMVRDKYYAWHARCWNQYSMGNEHEGFVSNPAWFTEAMYQASSAWARSKCNKYGIPKDRNHIIAHGQKNYSWWVTWMRNVGYSDTFIFCNTHSDPGPYWDWTHYMNLVNQVNEVPNRPTSLSATTASWQRIDLKWADNSNNENHFEVQQSSVSGSSGFNTIKTTADNIKTYAATGLKGNTKYWFRVRAQNGNGNSDWSNVDSATTFDQYPPDAPTGLTAVAVNDDKITLNWTDNSNNEDGFRIHQSSDGTTWTSIHDTGANATSYSVTGLRGNRTYYFRVRAFNTAQPVSTSDFSNVASDTTGPTAPTNLVATSKSPSQINLVWDDMSGSEAGFKIEQATASGGPWSQIATNVASDPTYSVTGLNASTTYWYRVRAYNGNANSMYSNTDSATTKPATPVITPVTGKTVVATSNLTFRVVSTDPNQTTGATNWTDFAAYSNGDTGVMFKKPSYASQTSAFVNTSLTNSTYLDTSYPTGHSGAKVLHAVWTYKSGQTNPYMQLSTDATSYAHPTIQGKQTLRFAIHSDHDVLMGFTFQETGTSAAYGNDGGSTGDTEYVCVTNIISGSPKPSMFVAANTWTTIYMNCQKDPVMANSGDGHVVHAKGIMRNVIIWPLAYPGSLQNDVFLDNFSVYTNNTLTFSLLSPPTGATIDSLSGDFSWAPTSGQVGQFNISVKVVDQLGLADTNTFKVTVTSAGNAAPTLASIGSKTVKEGLPLTFTATATDPDVGQTLTYSLDAGAPSGATIGSSSGAFSWTPGESQGGASYPITVRVTDNGSPSSNDFETITVTVSDVNVAPVWNSISDQTINEGATLNYTVTATDADLPANTLTYSLLLGPANMTINSNSGAITWPTTESDGPNTNQITVRASDNGTPKLWKDATFNVIVNEINNTPVLTISNSVSTSIVLTDLENYTDDAYNGTVMFRQPSFSGSTSTFMDASLANTTETTTNSPGGVVSMVLKSSFAFKTGQTNPWLRLTSNGPLGSEYSLPNPIIDCGKHLKFDVYCDKSLKLCLGIRETGSQGPLGTDGGVTGNIEFVGATGKNGAAPICTRTLTANTWTTVDFDLPNESCTAFTGDGSLAPGKGVLECIAIVPNGGTGIHNLYLDNFKIYNNSTNFTVNTGEEINLDCFATDSDMPGQNLTFSLDAGAPTNAVINDVSGVFTWIPTPEQSPSTNSITIRVTDDGVPPMSAAQTITVKVVKINTPPNLSRPGDFAIELNSVPDLLTITNDATDDDIPANSLTFSLTGSVPSGATINSASGLFTWTPPTSVLTNFVITVRVTDNGNPPLYSEQQFNVAIVPTNTAPTLILSTASVTEPIVNYETFANNTANGAVMFKAPNFATTTSAYIDTQTNYTRITNSIPTGNTNSVGSRALVARWNFKTGTTNYWIRLTTTNTTSLPNPTLDLSGHLRFDIQSSKALKVGLGIRETGTSAAYGANGGTTGGIEWVGVTNKVGTNPVPSRQIAANTWTTLDFNLASEPCTNFSGGNSILAAGKGVLEHLILKGEGGTGTYTVYMDNFSVVSTTNLPATITMNAGSTLSFTASGTDPNPGAGLTFGIDADFSELHTNADINVTNGFFAWTPSVSDAGTTNSLTVSVEDSPTNGGVSKDGQSTFSIIVNSDPFGVQSGSGSGLVSSGETVTLTWPAVPGKTYRIQYKENAADPNWTDLDSVTATDTTASTLVSNGTSERFYRIAAVDDAAGSDQ